MNGIYRMKHGRTYILTESPKKELEHIIDCIKNGIDDAGNPIEGWEVEPARDLIGGEQEPFHGYNVFRVVKGEKSIVHVFLCVGKIEQDEIDNNISTTKERKVDVCFIQIDPHYVSERYEGFRFEYSELWNMLEEFDGVLEKHFPNLNLQKTLMNS